MYSLQSVLESKKIIQSKGRVNSHYEQAEQILNYLKIPHTSRDVIFMLKLMKKYGAQRVASLTTFIKDYNNFDVKRWKGLFIWKLKQS